MNIRRGNHFHSRKTVAPELFQGLGKRGGRLYSGTVPKLGDLTTDEYSFVIKCTASRHLPVRRKTPPPCRGGGPKGRRGFPPSCHSARRTKRPLWPPQGKQNGIMAAARRTEGSLRPRRRETPSAPSGLVPLRGGTVLPSAWRTKGSLRPPHGKQKGRYDQKKSKCHEMLEKTDNLCCFG